MPTITYEAYFDRFAIELTAGEARYGSQPGADATDAIRDLLLETDIAERLDAIPADDIRAELKEYGGWEDDELENDARNRARILWIACNQVREEFKL